MKKLLLALALLMGATPAKADPVSLYAAFTAWASTAAGAFILKVALVVGVNAYTASSLRRKQRRLRAEQVAEFNNGLENRTVTLLTADPDHRAVLGRCITGGDVIAVFETDKLGLDSEGNSYTKVDGYKHFVVHIATHQSQAIHDTLFEGVKIGPLDAQGWCTSWLEEREIVFTTRIRLPYEVSSFVSAFDGTTDRVADLTLSTDKKTVSGPANVKLRLKYMAVRDEFMLKKKGTRVVNFTGTVTLPYDVLAVLSLFPSSWDHEGLGAPDLNLITISPDRRTLSTTLTQPVQVHLTVAGDTPTVRISTHLGAPGQAADAYLLATVPEKWTAQHTLDGLTYAVITVDLEHQPFQGGPGGFTFDVSGVLAFDPRTNTTAWTQNNALLTNWYLRSPMGLGCDADEIDEAYLIAAANVCDEATTFTKVDPDFPSITSTVSLPRYTCNGVVMSSERKEQVVSTLAESMAGWVHDAGAWLISAGSWTPPVRDLTDDDLLGSIDVIQYDRGMDDTFNGFRSSYMPAGAIAPADATPYSNPVLVTADGEKLWGSVTLPFTDSNHRCQNLVRIRTEQSRTGMVIRFPGKQKLWRLSVGDRVRLTSTAPELNCTLKNFRVTDWQHTIAAPVSLVLEEDEPDSYDTIDSVVADPTRDVSMANPWSVQDITGLDIFSGTSELIQGTDGTIIVRARVVFDPPTDQLVINQGRVEVWYSRSYENAAGALIAEPMVRATPATDGRGFTYIAGLRDGDYLTVRVYAVNSLGVEGQSSYLSKRVLGKTEPPSNVTGLDSSVAGGIIPWTWDNPTDLDYQATEIRAVDSNWGSDAVPPLWRGRVSEWPESVTTAATYTRYFRHLDTGGRPSAASASRSQVVGSGDLGGASSAQPDLVLTPESVTLAADTFGAVSSWVDAKSTATLALPDGTDDTANGWTFSKVDTNVVSTLGGALNNVVTVSGYDPAAVAEDYANTVLQLHLDGNYKDSSRYNRSTSFVGPTGLSWNTSGAFGQALTTTAVTTPDGKVRFTGGADFRSRGGPWSLRAKFKMSALPVGSQTFYALGNGNKHLNFTLTAGGGSATVTGTWLPVSGSLTVATPALVTGQWYDIEMTYATDGRLRLFVNGVLQDTSGSALVSAVDDTATATTTWIDIGTHWSISGFTNVHFLGDIDEVRYIVEGGGRTTNYTVSPSAYPDSPYAAAAYVDVTATKGTEVKNKRFSLTTVPSAPQQVVAASLTVPQVTVFSDWDGNNVTLTGATSQLRCLIDGAESITQWQVTQASVSSGVTVTVSAAGLVTVTAFPTNADVGTVDFSLFRVGYPSQAVRLTIAKSRRPQTSVTGGGPASIVVAGDTTGTVPAASLPVAAAVSASQGGLVATTLYTWAAVASSGITLSSTTAASTSITAMDANTDSGTITWTGTRTDWPTLTWRASVSKTRLLTPVGVVTTSGVISVLASGAASSARIRLSSSGQIQIERNNSGLFVVIGLWHNPVTLGIGSGFEAVFVPSSAPSGSYTGTLWAPVPLSSDVTWAVGDVAGGASGVHSISGFIQIRTAGSTGDYLAVHSASLTASIP